MAIVNFTEARIRDLPLGSGIYRDEQVKGLMVVCHRTTRTFAVQGDVRRNGRHVRTVRVKIDRCDRRESLLTIKRNDVDLKSRIITVRHMKSRRPFMLPLSDFMADVLSKRMEADCRIGSEWLWPSPNSESGRVTAC